MVPSGSSVYRQGCNYLTLFWMRSLWNVRAIRLNSAVKSFTVSAILAWVAAIDLQQLKSHDDFLKIKLFFWHYPDYLLFLIETKKASTYWKKTFWFLYCIFKDIIYIPGSILLHMDITYWDLHNKFIVKRFLIDIRH